MRMRWRGALSSGLLCSSTVRELLGKSPGNFRGCSGNFRGSPGGLSRSSGELDSLPATRQICPQQLSFFESMLNDILAIFAVPEPRGPRTFKTPNALFRESRPAISIAWCKARIPGFPPKSIREGASSLLGRGPESPKHVSCSRAARPSPEKTTCSFPYRFRGKSRNSGLVPGNRDPKSRPFFVGRGKNQ